MSLSFTVPTLWSIQIANLFFQIHSCLVKRKRSLLLLFCVFPSASILLLIFSYCYFASSMNVKSSIEDDVAMTHFKLRQNCMCEQLMSGSFPSTIKGCCERGWYEIVSREELRYVARV